ncbi:MAG TPA: Zn-ribbon domain-containing OB-fold protein [Tepidiformaceae bacterium]|nr:Zn-ribbon domain-containing OB-fold protein [Tepidiformaceae bacterium]
MPKYRTGETPLPTPTPISQPFWDAAREHRLTLQRCSNGHVFYYARSHCPKCLSNQLTWFDASGKGTVYSYTVARRPTSWEFENDGDFVIAVIELEEGPRMTSRLVEIDPDAVRIGQAVEVVFDDINGEIALPYFKPR